MNSLPSSSKRVIRPSPAAQVQAVEDLELVRRFLAGDETAFTLIVERHRARILMVAEGLLRNHGDAEEVAQDTFLRAHRSLNRFRGDSSLATWLHRIASNLAKNRYWYFFRRRRHDSLSLDFPLGEDGDSTLGDLFSSGEATPVQDSCRQEFLSLIEQCMSQLDPRCQEILRLRNVHHLGYQEIALQLGLNPGTVKSRLARARDRLRREMAATCPEFAADAPPEDWFEPSRPAASAVPRRA